MASVAIGAACDLRRSDRTTVDAMEACRMQVRTARRPSMSRAPPTPGRPRPVWRFRRNVSKG